MPKQKLCECGCGQFVRFDKYRLRKYLLGHNRRGKHHTNESNLKNKIAHTGKKHSMETKQKMRINHSGSNNPWYGKKHTEQSKKAMGDTRKGKYKGENSHSWKGGRHKQDTKGYMLVYMPNHPRGKGSYVYEHRLVMEQHLGRYLESTEVVHHINQVKTDNRLPNLWLYAGSSEHMKNHAEFEKAKKDFLEKIFSNHIEECFRIPDQNGVEENAKATV